MRQLLVRPEIVSFSKTEDFVEAYDLGKGDLILTSEHLYKKYLEKYNLEADVIFYRKYGNGEPTDAMVEAIAADVKGPHKRIIGIGGGTVLDVAKLFALKELTPVCDLFDGLICAKKDKELVLVPTTCGTGSEVTNISILALLSKGTKKGLANDELFADSAVLVPELMEDLPMSAFATSSIDALVHAVESSLSPKASDTTRLFGYEAIRIILSGYMYIREKGPESRKDLLEKFLMASMYAGIAFGNAGCAAVHALSYPLGATYHVAHGESNYAMFTGVMNNYMEIRQDGEIAKLTEYIADILACDKKDVFTELEKLLDCIIVKKPLREYGMKEAEIELFADSVLLNQQRLLANNFVTLDRDRIIKIYRECY